ncbi:hypothetical protein M427DRAFT_69995 [Gonapodya prolifera JEL478]|uniref:Calcineurin-like phosphoesterase domain-containing protein n=1 Tax=Gonapodya prolifera (strain JEL478) TaxID=1344416 RepID=A0A139AEX8_GONPJ|nr:hypothetical protein M427DRAFT_69995 [Gonapodya prolifera JEL478]|eukprot:KXS15361.1 hypothetical protein M427DRAFT_69995 [Gonapodya prolifera JEL478]
MLSRHVRIVLAEIGATTEESDSYASLTRAMILSTVFLVASLCLLQIAGTIAGKADANDPRFTIATPLSKTFQYLVENRGDDNIVFVAHLGDVTEHGGDAEETAAGATFSRGLGDRIPYSVLAGNHDVKSSTTDARGSTPYLGNFGPQRFAKMPTFGGAYHIVKAGGRNWLIMALDWRQSDSCLVWVQGILDAHKTLPVILTTHDIVSADDGKATLSSCGQKLWDNLISKNDQIFFELPTCTYLLRTDITSTTPFGSTLQTTKYYGGAGMIRPYHFDLIRNRIDIEAKSPWLLDRDETLHEQETLELTEDEDRFSLEVVFVGTLAYWRFDSEGISGIAGPGVVANGTIVKDLSGNKINLRAGLVNGNDPKILTTSTDHHSYQPSHSSVCFDGAKAPSNRCRIFEAATNAHDWMGVYSWQGRSPEVNKIDGDPDEPTLSLNVSPEWFAQFVQYPIAGKSSVTAWSHAIEPEKWHHVAVVNDGKVTTMYVDSSVIVRNPSAPAKGVALTGKPFVLGATPYANAFDQSFCRYIGDVSIVERPLKSPVHTTNLAHSRRSELPNLPEPRCMSADLNAQLIEAVESGSEVDVKRLIDEGASPDARKRVTLRAKVDDGKGGFEWMEDTVDCENALGLAILHARVAIVRLLLDNGASVDSEVQWKVANCQGTRDWTSDEWQRQRWWWTCGFPSLLTAAIGHCGKSTDFKGSKYNILNINGQLSANLRGGTVTIEHPKKSQERSVRLTVEPKMEIVRSLLEHGAIVTDVDLKAAQKNPNREFLQTLESHHRTLVMNEPTSGLKHVKDKLNKPKPHFAAGNHEVAMATENTAVGKRRIAKGKRDIAALKSLTSALVQNGSTVRSEVTELHSRSNARLVQMNATLRSHNSTLKQDNASRVVAAGGNIGGAKSLAEIAGEKAKLMATQTNVAALVQDVSTLQNEVTSLRNGSITADQEHSTPYNHTSSLEQEVSTLRARITLLEQDNTALRLDIPSLRRETTVLREENISLRQENSALRSQRAAAETRADAADERARDVERKYAEKRTLSSGAERLEQDNKSLRQEVSDLRRDNVSLRQDVKDLFEEISTLHSDNSNLRFDYNTLRTEGGTGNTGMKRKRRDS